MTFWRALYSVWAFCILGACHCATRAQVVSNYAVRVSASVQASPPRITLSWPADTAATGYNVYRKSRDAFSLDQSAWGTHVSLSGASSSYVDSAVSVGSAYEYRVSKSGGGWGEGYIYAGIEVPLVETRGKVVLLVDQTLSVELEAELTRLEQDLAGDGWEIVRHDVPRTAVSPSASGSEAGAARAAEIAYVKGLILAACASDESVKAVFLFGHVPVPYSGEIAPDDHVNHKGAWPADVFYGDTQGTWTDSWVNSTSATDPRNHNVVGDGKFDQPWLQDGVDLKLQVGRVDLSNLSAFSLSEVELLRRYLAKDHNFRHKRTLAEHRGLVRDGLGYLSGQVPAVFGWRNFAPFFGAQQSFATADWFGTLASESYLWGYACGGGHYTSIDGVGTTGDLASRDPRVVFTMFFGSYFGDWDSNNNFLRAAIATPTFTLTSAWAGRPGWHFHHMALGETIGFSTRLAQKNFILYAANYYPRYVHVALMGDPTLRMHVVGPPAAVLAMRNSSGGVDLGWGASTDTVLGYHVYRASAALGPYSRVNSELITGTTYTDSAPGSDRFYMVRAVKLEVSGSGSYYNASQGFFQTVEEGQALLPTSVGITSSANPAVPGQSVTFAATASPVPPGEGTPTGSVQFKIDGVDAGAPVALENGTAIYASSSLGHGSHTVAAAYAGDANFEASSGQLHPDQLINTPPVAGSDTIERDPTGGTKVSIDTLLSNDSDPDADTVTFLGVSATSAHGGIVTRDDSWIFYSPAPGFTESDSFTYTIGDGFAGPQTGTVTVAIRLDDGPSQNLTIQDLGNGSYQVRGDAIPGRTYRIQFTTDLSNPDWQTLGTVAADVFGVFVFIDTPGPSTRFYRSAYP
ncbi:MAG: Ig-like domain repeat protein [Verrucomicrobiia bacterium]